VPCHTTVRRERIQHVDAASVSFSNSPLGTPSTNSLSNHTVNSHVRFFPSVVEAKQIDVMCEGSSTSGNEREKATLLLYLRASAVESRLGCHDVDFHLAVVVEQWPRRGSKDAVQADAYHHCGARNPAWRRADNCLCRNATRRRGASALLHTLTNLRPFQMYSFAPGSVHISVG
jgi:hypothetical protein